jgi:CarboxypepD_reg-like domain
MKKMKLIFVLLIITSQTILAQMNFKIKGNVVDQDGTPIQYAHLSIKGKPIGTVSNAEGSFIFNILKEYETDTLVISHIGHIIVTEPISTIVNENVQIVLEKHSVELAEINVKPLNPIEVIHQIIDKIPENYWSEPILLKSFYRETIKENDHYTEYAEGVIDIYKTPLIIGAKKFTPDQLMLIKGRRKNDLSDYQISKNPLVTIGGPVSCNYSDRMKYRLSFLRKSTLHKYDYDLVHTILYDNRPGYIISFDQKDSIENSLFKGNIYVDRESLAVLKIQYTRSPKGIEYIMPGKGVQRLMKVFKMTFENITEMNIVDYQCIQDQWCVKSIQEEEHIYMTRKGIEYDMEIKKNLIVTEVVTENVNAFDKKEALSPKEFKNQLGEYDQNFWEGFNYLLPPEEMVSKLKLTGALTD